MAEACSSSPSPLLPSWQSQLPVPGKIWALPAPAFLGLAT